MTPIRESVPAEERAVSDDRNRTIRLTIDMTYNAEQMHYDDPEGIRWFNEEVLGGALQMWSDEIGDWIGEVEIVETHTALAGETGETE